ncbi:MAG: hypothetical protein Q8N98_05130 [bacterium]|nr:hypothetical protein [bacterium]
MPKLINSKKQDSETFQAEIQIPGKLSIAFSLLPENLMRARISEKHPGFSASYLRWSVDGIADCSNESVQGVAEYMDIQKL